MSRKLAERVAAPRSPKSLATTLCDGLRRQEREHRLLGMGTDDGVIHTVQNFWIQSLARGVSIRHTLADFGNARRPA